MRTPNNSKRVAVYNYFRDYDPSKERYIQSDPIGLDGGANSFAYVEANPMSMADPEGLSGKAPGKSSDPLYPNGNYGPGYNDQDWRCSSIASPLNFDKCSKQCCIAYGACYQRNHCNQSSWVGNYKGKSAACQQCNSDAMRCIKQNCGPSCGNGTSTMSAIKQRWINDHRVAGVLAALSGVLIYFFAKQASENVELQGVAIFYVWLVGTFLAAIIFGFFYPRRAWQWGIYILLGQVAFTALTEGGDRNQLPLGVILYLFLLIPMLLAGVIGGYLAACRV